MFVYETKNQTQTKKTRQKAADKNPQGQWSLALGEHVHTQKSIPKIEWIQEFSTWPSVA